mmetsp:Transcript_33993/g.88683  ORF Transcript_33993/g.88683 Transcript_33993/m.88683 type:complete len:634 (-) Transcript_33993:804-2705(-)
MGKKTASRGNTDEVERALTAPETERQVVNATDQYAKLEEEALSIKDRIQKHGVQVKVLMDFIDSEITQEQSCESLPWAIALFAAFAVSVAMHDQNNVVLTTKEMIQTAFNDDANFGYVPGMANAAGVTEDVGMKVIWNIHTTDHLWAYLQEGAMASLSGGFYENYDPYNTNISNPKALLWQYNRLVAGVRLQQQIEPTGYDKCTAEELAWKFSGPCSPWDWVLTPQLKPSLTLNNPTRKEWLSLVPENGVTAEQQIAETFKRLDEEQYIDAATARLQVSFVLYNAELNMVTVVYLLFAFTRPGLIHRDVLPVSVLLDPYQHKITWATDIVFVILIARIVITEAYELQKHLKKSAQNDSSAWEDFKSYVDIWNVVDWTSVAGAIACISLWVTHCLGVDELRNWLVTSDLDPVSVMTLDPITRTEQYDRLMELLEPVAVHSVFAQHTMSIFPFVIVLRLFKSFAAQPRLSLVTQTLYKASVDVLHFLLVFLTIFFTYAVGGMSLFGHHMEDFATILRAVNSCWRVILGDFDMSQLILEGPGYFEAMLWFWTFTLLVVLIMFNMVLSIIMDSYTEVKSQLGGDSETLFSQTYEIYRRWRGKQKGERVSLEYIYKCFGEEADTEEERKLQETFHQAC